MRGLPDSAVWGTYKRLTRKPRRGKNSKENAYYQQNADVLNAMVARLVRPFAKQR
jgi:hypothetical protein